ncbi:hypothetical protein [Paenibacillus sp. J22TS3]|uniref:hypothetical protein n=1 Tax=Paenibacillus sp. J22TS3 TaxID=2807192 RepID=UPI001B2667D7|nr:hypothetical protein [Paenibacillus sp. J22TS3]GIP19808.1 hypothetical protein J22TS3_00830 [Paenibacillus sp. J22TS3]
MPTTKRENMILGLMMCCGMVIFMTFYNLTIHGQLGNISAKGLLTQLLLIFFTAAIVELLIVGPVAKRIAFAMPFDKSNKLYVIVALALCMVTGMVLIMSLYGLGTAYFSNTLGSEPLIESYCFIVLKNFIFAFPLQLFIVGPLVRFLFRKFVKVRT